MKDNQLTYILLIIASILLILNGIFAFEHTIAMILLSLLFIIIGVVLLIVVVRLMFKGKKN
ncbi:MULTISPECIES: hypothetical protein [Staphylococcus]|uniref:Uncharacterized protein n=1 Tax=Staphylococcus caprae TaxID=29380 RepID=A0ABM7FR23_9STAP|nr:MULTISPECIES: hypothetical protein [Staphylococcus]EES40931.1 hypothetical protein HMPREF0793_1446 [Staphylococcus caprae M23864:W1]MBN6824943.1 hypothetical protein [Staphylococcus caprae]MBU5271600.1 hypothetical protein [Staphylococcus caprae]MBX5319296.1 hypothetical protein [Staphylococcus caprae]MBX5322217.1 hypothetical protein [Staphylococcus caprae]